MLFEDFFDAANVIIEVVVEEFVASDVTCNNGDFVPFAPPFLRDLKESQISASIWILVANGTAVVP